MKLLDNENVYKDLATEAWVAAVATAEGHVLKWSEIGTFDSKEEAMKALEARRS